MKNLNRLKGFTMAETIITLVIIGVVAALVMGVLNLKNVRQRDLLARYDLAYMKLSDIIGVAAQTSKNHDDWSSDANSLRNITCTDEKGNDIANKSLCLKKALLSVSSTPKDCDKEIDACITRFEQTSVQLRQVFPHEWFKPAEMTAFTMPGGVDVAIAYIDANCHVDIPIRRNENGTVESIEGCGFLMVDTNGKAGPNSLSNTNRNALIDRFLIAIQERGLVRSQILIDETAGCAEGTHFDPVKKECTTPFVCPNKEFYDSVSFDPATMTEEDVPYDGGTCKEYRCKSGEPIDVNTKECPPPCPDPINMKRKGGLWVKEGGDLPDNQQKACCYPIKNQQELAAINNDADTLSRDYCLIADITMDRNGAGYNGGQWWSSIGGETKSLAGSFYGNGHIIKDFYSNRTASVSNNYTASLFNGLYSSDKSKKLENLGLENINITHTGTNNNISSIVGGIANTVQNYNINNVYTSGTINVNSLYAQQAGGIIGEILNTTVKNVYSNTNITLHGNSIFSYAGGLVAKNSFTAMLSNGYNTGNIVQKSGQTLSFIGGTAGYSMSGSPTLSNLYNTGDIQSVALATGGVAGEFNNGVMFGLYNLGNISVTNTQAGTYTVGGVVSYPYSGSGSLRNAYNEGNINAKVTVGGTKLKTGGIVGSSNTNSSSFSLNNAYNIGNVSASTTNTADEYSGGVISEMFPGENVQNTYSSGTVTGGSKGGCVSYYKGGNLINCMTTTSTNIGNISVSSGTISNIKVYSAAEMKSIAQTVFAAFDRAVWKIVNGFFPTILSSHMPPQPHRDCRNNPNAHGGCFDVLNTPNTWDFNYVWAWKKPSTGGSIENPIFRWQCKPYRADGFDCCRPSYANNEPKLQKCPDLFGPAPEGNERVYPAKCSGLLGKYPNCIDY